MRFLVLGDVHANWHDLNSVMKNVDFNLKIKYDAVIQVGDFGFSKFGLIKLDSFNVKYVKNEDGRLTTECSPLKFHKPVYVIDGNHEDHDFIKNSNKEEWKTKYNIHYQPRGTYMDVNGYKIGFLGGALNADRAQEGSIDKETTNYILNKQIERAINEWNEIGGIDTLITHSCPSNMGVGMQGHPNLYMAVQRYIVEAGHGENNFTDCGEAPLTALYKGLKKKPKFWIYGHFHQIRDVKVYNTQFMCVGSTDSSDGRKYVKPLILDMRHNIIEFHDKMALNFDGEHSTR
jgi:predicted phosphodiesterase